MYKRQILDHACRTDRSSGGGIDVRLTDVRRAEALSTTAVRSLAEKFDTSLRGRERDAAVQGGFVPRSFRPRVYVLYSRRGGGVAAVTESRARANRSTTLSALVIPAAASRSARSASSTRR